MWFLTNGGLLSNNSTDNGRFLESEKFLRSQSSPIRYFKSVGVINAIPKKMETSYHTN